MSRRAVVLLVVAPLLAVACSTEEASPATSRPVSTIAPVTTVAGETTLPETPTTQPDPATTLAPTTAPPTPTTTPPPSGTPVDGSIPLLVGGAGGGWLLLGSWETSAWRRASTEGGAPITPSIPAGSTLAVTGLQAGVSSGVTGANVESCFDGRIGPTITPAVPAPEPPGFGYAAVALPAIWPLQPRRVAVVDAAVPAYEAAGRVAFTGLPVDTTDGAVEQIVVADLDGDGDEEALVAFEQIAPASIVGAPGDFSALLLIDTATGASSTVELAFVGPLAEGEAPVIERFRVLDVADLNGDGRMEVVVHTWYFEGAGAIVYEYDGAALDEVLGAGCGA